MLFKVGELELYGLIENSDCHPELLIRKKSDFNRKDMSVRAESRTAFNLKNLLTRSHKDTKADFIVFRLRAKGRLINFVSISVLI